MSRLGTPVCWDPGHLPWFGKHPPPPGSAASMQCSRQTRQGGNRRILLLLWLPALQDQLGLQK